jgi:hypothetical protein
MAVKVERSIEQVPAGFDTPKRLDQPTVDRGSFIRAKGGCSFAKHDIEPFLHHLIAEKSVARFVGCHDPFLRNSLFARIGWINRVNQQVGVEKELPFIALAACKTPPGSEVTDGRRHAPDIFGRQTRGSGIAREPFPKEIIERRVLSFSPSPCALNERLVRA